MVVLAEILLIVRSHRFNNWFRFCFFGVPGGERAISCYVGDVRAITGGVELRIVRCTFFRLFPMAITKATVVVSVHATGISGK